MTSSQRRAADRRGARLRQLLRRGPAERSGLDPRTPWWGEHRSRYHFAAELVAGRTALDVGCGTGYGTDILADAGAAFVVGVDASPDLMRPWNAPGRVRFVLGSALALPLADHLFDVVVCMETIEHISEADVLVAELARVCRPDGIVVLSTPNALYTRPIDGVPRNPFHLHEYEPGELMELLGRHFRHVELLAQLVDPRYPVVPFWQSSGCSGRPQPRLWRLLHRTPFAVKDRISRLRWNRSFYPGEYDYVFRANDMSDAPVLVARCRR